MELPNSLQYTFKIHTHTHTQDQLIKQNLTQKTVGLPPAGTLESLKNQE